MLNHHLKIQRDRAKIKKIWNRFIQPILEKLSPLERKCFSYNYDESLSHEISQIVIIRMERKVLIPAFNSLGISYPEDFRTNVLAPLWGGRADNETIQFFLNLLTTLNKEGMNTAFLYWLDDWFGGLEEVKDADAFIRSLRVKVESDSEISIQEPGKTPVIYHCTSIGFKSEKTKMWGLFIKTLKSPTGIIKLPPSRPKDGWRDREYEAQRKLLRDLNEKLVAFLNRQYSLGLPEGYKLYESYSLHGEKRSYKFIFKVKDTGIPSRYESMPKETLLREIDNLLEDRKGKEDEVSWDKLVDACQAAIEKGYMTEAQVERLLKNTPVSRDADIAKTYQEELDRYSPDLPDLS